VSIVTSPFYPLTDSEFNQNQETPNLFGALKVYQFEYPCQAYSHYELNNFFSTAPSPNFIIHNYLISDIIRIDCPYCLTILKKITMKKYLLLFVGLGALIAFMRFVLLPLVMEVVASDAFLVDSKDVASLHSLETPLTAIAFNHCNTYVKSELGKDVSVSFADKPTKAWGFGGYKFMIRSNFTVAGSTKPQNEYACQITYNNGDNQEGIADYENWTIDGLTGLDRL
jgi:hypothetical protein